jgi:predicted ATPase
VVALAGEPGIGKTRLTREIMASAESQGAQVFWGNCYEWQGAPPYWPWIQIIRSYIQGSEPEGLKDKIGAGASDISEIVPELRDLMPGLSAPPSPESEQARFRLFDSIAGFLKRAGQEQPLALVLDDLQWADRPSLLLLEFLAQNLQEARLLLLGTYRDIGLTRSHPLSNTLGELTKHPHFWRVLLRGVDREAVHQFIRGSLSVTPSEPMVAALHARTQGNPLFLTEMLRLMSREWTFTAEAPPGWGDWGSKVPEGVKDVISRRCNSLSDRCNRVLTIASVIGREFDLRVLSILMSDTQQHELLDALEEALSVHVIKELPDAVGRYQFSHVLVQDALASELSAARRARLHGLAGEALEQLYEPNLAPHSAELAYHFAEAAPVFGADKIVRYSIMAGEQALSTYAYEDASDHFQRALNAKQSSPTDAQTASTLFSLAKAQGAAGQIHEAWDSMRRAFDYYFAAGDVEQAVAAAQYPLFYASGVQDAGKMVSQALTLVSHGSIEAGLLLARYDLLINLETGDYRRAQDTLGRALAIAQKEGDTSLEIQALTNAADVDWYHLRWPDVISRST